MKGRVKFIAAAILLAVTLASGVVMAQGVSVPLPTNLTGSNEYPIGSTATFQWFNDRHHTVTLDGCWVVGPLPSTNRVFQKNIFNARGLGQHVTYGPINVPLTWPGIAVGDQYVLHVHGQEAGSRLSFDDTFTFKIVAAATPPSPNPPSPNPGSNGISINPLLLFLLMAQHANSNPGNGNGTPSQPNPRTPPATQETGSITATVTQDDAVTDAVVIAYKDGTQLIDIIQGTAAAGTNYMAKTEHTKLGAVTGVANLELPVGDWNIIAMKACGDNYFWISEVKKLTVFELFDIPTDLPLITKIQLQLQNQGS